jgi:hypothetical protein
MWLCCRKGGGVEKEDDDAAGLCGGAGSGSAAAAALEHSARFVRQNAALGGPHTTARLAEMKVRLRIGIPCGVCKLGSDESEAFAILSRVFRVLSSL